MKLDIFQSDKGDCILLESKDGRRILCDGGMSQSMQSHVAPVLAKLRQAKKKIDFAYVSHIDQDHIAGVLCLLQDELAWRVFEHHRKTKKKKANPPKVLRPPEFGGLWHNSFHSQLSKNAGKVEDMLAAAVPALLATRVPKLQDAGEELYDIATSIPEAIKVSRLASSELLGIPLNKIPGTAGSGKLLMARPGQKPFKLGSLRLTILGPTRKELAQLRKGWNNWLRENKANVEKINEQLQKKINEFAASLGAAHEISLGDWNGIPNHENVTAPNIASLMFMVEENGKKLLLTGDSQQDFIIAGLETTGFLTGHGLHIDALKVQHHGSKNNMDDEFAARVSADHYIFCGNGEHGNPHLDIIERVCKSRIESDQKIRARAPTADGRPFKLWFSSSAEVGPRNPKGEAHMREVEKLVKEMQKRAKGKMKFVFNKHNFLTLKL